MSDRIRKALFDIGAGFQLSELWLFVGWRDVRKHYQRSILGPFWLTLNMGILVGGLGLLYSQIFGQEIRDYLPLIALGFILWALMGNVINEACSVFLSAPHTIRQVRLPLSVYVYQFVWKHFITFLHNFVIYLVLLVVFARWPGANALLFVPALALYLLNAAFAALLFGTLSARFRDIPILTASVTQIFFFLTPIFWDANVLARRAVFLDVNPFYHFIQIGRLPLLGVAPPLHNWLAAGGLTAVFGTFAILVFARFRARIAYWV